MKRYEGSKACAGCGTPGHEKPRASADAVCYDCRDLLAAGKKYQVMMRDQEAECIKVVMYPLHVWDGQSYISRTITDHFFDLVKTLNLTGRKIVYEETIYLGEHSNHYRVEVTVTKETGEQIKTMYKAFKEHLPALYEKGKEHGANLLMQLNAGNLTMDKFNDSIKTK